MIARLAPKIGDWERKAITIWNALGGEIGFMQVAAAAAYYEFDDFDALMEMLSAIRTETNRQD